MNGLEIFAIIILSAFAYAIISLMFTGIVAGDLEDSSFVLAWLYGMALFVVVVLMWATDTPFPIGG